MDRFDYQKEFAKRVIERAGSKFPLSQEDKVGWTKEYVLYIISECNDLLNQLDWKRHWSTGNKTINDNIGIEIIDLQKYIWGLAQIWDIGQNEFNEIFDRKSKEVESKWLQEEMVSRLPKLDKVCVIDIDGVLVPYPDCFFDWVHSNYGVNLGKKDTIEIERFKNLYRESGAKKSLPVIESSKEALIRLKKKGYTVILLTKRPVDRYKRIYSDTLDWLSNNKIPYDYIFWAVDKKILFISERCPNVTFAVDDDSDTCKEFRNSGIKTYKFGSDINSLLDIEELK